MRSTTRFFILLLLVVFLQVLAAAPAHAQDEGGASSGSSDGASSGASDGASSDGSGDGAGDAATNGDEDVKEKIEDTFGSVVEAGKEVYESIKDTVKDVIGSLTGAGGDAAAGAGDAAGGDTAAGGEDAAGGSSMDELISKLNEGGLEDLASQIQSGVDNVESFVNGEAESGQEFVDMIKSAGDQMGQPIDLYGDAQKLGDENPILKDVETLSDNLATDATDVADSVKQSLTQAGDGAEGVYAEGGSLAEGYKGDAEKTMSDQIDTLSGLRADPAAFEKTYGEMFNVKGTSGDTTASASMSLAGASLFTGADDRGKAGNDISQNSLLLKGDAYVGARIDASVESSYLGGAGKFSAENQTTLGLSAQGEGNAKWMTGDAVLDAKARAEVTAGITSSTTVKNEINLGGGMSNNTTAVVDAVAGAQATADGKLYAGKNGLEASGSAEARVGAWVDGKATTGVQYKGENVFSATGTAGAGLGVGAGVSGGAAFRTDKVGFNAQVTLGPVKLGGGVYVNPVAMGQMAVDKGSQAIAAVGNGAKAIGNGARNLWNRLF